LWDKVARCPERSGGGAEPDEVYWPNAGATFDAGLDSLPDERALRS
jgi:hypothetical protein